VVLGHYGTKPWMQKSQDPKKLQYNMSCKIPRASGPQQEWLEPCGKKRGESVKGDILQNSAEQTWTMDKRAIGVLTDGC